MLLVVVLVIETLLAIVKKERIRAKRNDAALHAEAAAGRVDAHLLSSGLYRRPWLLTRSADPAWQALAGSAVMAIPPVGNRTPPRRRIQLLPAFYAGREDCSRAGKALPAVAC
jgi:hypothetical protein